MPGQTNSTTSARRPVDDRSARAQVPKGVCQELDLICWVTAGGVTLHALSSARSVDQSDIPADQLLDTVAVNMLRAEEWSDNRFEDQVVAEVAAFVNRVIAQVRRVRSLAP